MKFQQYLNEEDVQKKKEELRLFIKDNCKPFIKEFGYLYKDRKFIWRGYKRDIKDYKIFNIKKDRRPRIMTTEIHEFLSTIGKELFGWDIRKEGVFTADHHVSSTYGIPTVFIPIGNYKYIYVDLGYSDIYQYYDKANVSIAALNNWKRDRKTDYWKKRPEELKNLDREMKDMLELWKEKIYNEYKNEYKSTGLNKIINFSRTPFEAVFKCDRHMLLDLTYRDIISEIFQNI